MHDRFGDALVEVMGTKRVDRPQQLAGGAGNNRLNASSFTGAVSLTGNAGNDTLIGGAGRAGESGVGTATFPALDGWGRDRLSSILRKRTGLRG